MTGSVASGDSSDSLHSLRRVEFAPPWTLEELIQQMGESGAAELINRNIESLLVRGELDYVSQQLRTPFATTLAHREDGIASAMLKASAVLAFTAPEISGALQDSLWPGTQSSHWLEDRAVLALHFANDFRIHGGLQLPVPLLRVFTILPVLEGVAASALLAEAVELCRRCPDDLGCWLDPFPHALLDEVGMAALGPEEPEAPSAQAAASRELQSILSAVDQTLEGDGGNQLWTVAMAVALVAAGGAWWRFGWQGATLGLLLFVLAAVLPANKVDERLYESFVRIPLRRYVLETGASPAELVVALRQRGWTSAVRRLVSEVESDATLLLVSRLVAAGRRRGMTLEMALPRTRIEPGA